MEKRTEGIGVRVTPTVRKKAERLAEKKGWSLGDLINWLITRAK